MLDRGVPIDGVGDQGHLDTQFGFSGSRMTQDLQRYAGLGLRVAITEADVRTFVNNATDQSPDTGPRALITRNVRFRARFDRTVRVMSRGMCARGRAAGPSGGDGNDGATVFGCGLGVGLPGVEPCGLVGRALSQRRREGICG